jgi:hypothetical protein
MRTGQDGFENEGAHHDSAEFDDSIGMDSAAFGKAAARRRWMPLPGSDEKQRERGADLIVAPA